MSSSGNPFNKSLQSQTCYATLSSMTRKLNGPSTGGRRQSTRQPKVKVSDNGLPPLKLPPALSQLKFSEGGPESLSDKELMQHVLSLAVPESRVTNIAFTLLAQFGSFAKAIYAPDKELKKINGLGRDGIVMLRLVSVTIISILRAEVINRPVIGNWDSLIRYLTVQFAHEVKEKFHCLFLDSRNRMIADELMAEGTLNALSIYPREIIKRALDLHATALILVHNHPSSGPKPTKADFVATQGIKDAASNIGIMLHDSIIIAGTEWYSFREDGAL